MNQNIDSSRFDQIQIPRYPFIHHPSQEMSEEVFQAKGNLMKPIKTFLEKFNCIPFREIPKILLQAWEKFFAIQHEYLEKSSNSIVASNFNQEKKGPPQDSDIRQLVREECGIEFCEEQKKKMEDTMLELLEVCRQKEFYCMHNNVDDLIESALNSKLLSINLRSQRLDKKKQEAKNILEQPTKHGTQPEYSLSMRYEHLSTIPKMKSDEIIESRVKNLVPIPSEYEVALEDESKRDLPVLEDHSKLLSDSNTNDISSDDDTFENIDDHTEETRSGSTIAHANNSLSEYDSFCFEIDPDQGRLTSIVKNDISDDSTNDPLLEEVELFLASDNLIPPGIENFDYDSERDIHFLEELLIDDFISIPKNESSNFDHQDDPSFPRPPPKPPDVEFFFDLEPNSGEVISVVMNNIDELNEDECFEPGGKDLAKITKKQLKPNKIEQEIEKNAQKPDSRTFSAY
nr:hypothetical protein [Tanacetum cinerariifolium]